MHESNGNLQIARNSKILRSDLMPLLSVLFFSCFVLAKILIGIYLEILKWYEFRRFPWKSPNSTTRIDSFFWSSCLLKFNFLIVSSNKWINFIQAQSNSGPKWRKLEMKISQKLDISGGQDIHQNSSNSKYFSI
jgi:hypothetical protein